MIDPSPHRRVLVVTEALRQFDFRARAEEAGWDVVAAESFAQARALLQSMACAVMVAAAEVMGRDFFDGLRWLAARVGAPAILVTPADESVVVPALSQGMLWAPPEAVMRCRGLFGALLGQAARLGEERRERVLAERLLREGEQRAERLVRMLWEVVPGEGPPRWFAQRQMMERLDEELSRCVRHGAPLSVVLGEVTPATGQTLATEQADRLAEWFRCKVGRNIRRCDVAGHYGPHGFVMLMPQTSPEQAAGACKRLRAILAHPPHPAPARVALACVTTGEGNVPAVLRHAEEQLDEEKSDQNDPLCP